MPNEPGFTGGIKDALSAFSTFALLGYYGSLSENMEENRQLRQRELSLQEAAATRDTEKQDFLRLEFLTKNAGVLPQDVVVNGLNSVSSRYGGKPVSTTDITTFRTSVEDTIKQIEGMPTSEERRTAVMRLAVTAQTHPAYGMVLSSYGSTLQDLVEKPAATEFLKTLPIPEARRESLLQNIRPGEVMKVWQDGDYRKMAVATIASKTVEDVRSGRPVPEGELREALTAYQMAGFQVGPDGKDIVKNTIGANHYNSVITQGESTRLDVVQPLQDIVSRIDHDKLASRHATREASRHATREASLTDVGGAKGSRALGLLQEAVPDLTDKQTMFLHNMVTQSDTILADADKQIKDMESRARILKARPDLSATDIALIDQSVRLDKQALTFQTEPYRRLQTYLRDPSTANFQKLNSVLSDTDTTLRRWEKDRGLMLTEAEKHEKFQVEKGRTDLATTQATNAFSTGLNKILGDHPEVFDEDGTMNVSQASKLAQPLAADISKQYGVSIDPGKLIKEYATASKRSVPRTETLEKLTPEQAAKFETFVAGRRLTSEVQAKLIVDGKVNRGLLATTIGGGVPFTGGRSMEAAILDAMEAEYRARTGAAMPDEEVVRAKKIFVPSNLDSDQTIKDKLSNLAKHFQDKIDLVDPKGKLQSRLGRPAEPVGKVLSYEEWLKAGKPKARGK